MMKEYTIYDSDSGAIIRSLRCTVDMLDVNVFENEKYIEGYYKPSDYIIQNEKAVEKKPDSDEIRLKNISARNSLLKASDWTQLSDVSLSDDKIAEWKTYRQALRDLPTHAKWPNLESGDWPTPPS